MNAFFQLLLSSSPAWGTFAVLVAVIWLAFRMERGFNNVKNEFTVVRTEMREAFLKVDARLAEHDRDIKEINKKVKQIKKRLGNVETRLGNVEKTMKTP